MGGALQGGEQVSERGRAGGWERERGKREQTFTARTDHRLLLLVLDNLS